MDYKKYSFATEAEFEALIEGLKVEPIDGIEQPQIKYTAIPVTCIITPAVIEDGKVIKDAVLDSKYNADIVWDEIEPESFKPFQVWPKGIGQHIIAGWENQYKEDYDKIVLPENKI